MLSGQGRMIGCTIVFTRDRFDEVMKMQKAGGIIGLIAGIFGVLAATITLLFGGMG